MNSHDVPMKLDSTYDGYKTILKAGCVFETKGDKEGGEGRWRLGGIYSKVW